VSPTIDPFHFSALCPRFWNVLYVTIYCHLLQTPVQFGFQQKHSTLQQMLVFFNEITLSNNSQVDAVYLDWHCCFWSLSMTYQSVIVILLSFADDTKCVKTISELCDCHFLQADLNRLYQWSPDWNQSPF